jgi:hypothetical protein
MHVRRQGRVEKSAGWVSGEHAVTMLLGAVGSC